MSETKVEELVEWANRVYQRLNNGMKELEGNPKVQCALSEIRGSMEQINRISGEVKWEEGGHMERIVKERDSEANGEGDDGSLVSPGKKTNKNERKVRQTRKQDCENEVPYSKIKRQPHRGPYRQYSEQVKEKVIAMHRRGTSFNKISRFLNIPSKNIIRWCRNGTQRKPGAGRKVLDPEMEAKLYTWLQETYKPHMAIHNEIVRAKAKQFSSVEEFQGSLGWFKNFIRRQGIKDKYKFT